MNHPLAMFLLITGYLSLIVAFAYLMLVVVPTSPVRSRVARIGAMGLYGMSVFGNVTLLGAVLFRPDATLGDLVGTWSTSIVSLLTIMFVCMFLGGFYIETGRLLHPPSAQKPADKPEDQDVAE